MVATAPPAGGVFRQIHGSEVAIEVGWALQVQHVLVRSSFLVMARSRFSQLRSVFFLVSWDRVVNWMVRFGSIV